MILVFTLLASLVPVVVLIVEFRKLRLLSRLALVFQVIMFALIYVSWLGISF